MVKPEWLVEIAPKYYNLDHFAKGDVKLSLERVVERVGNMKSWIRRRKKVKIESHKWNTKRK